MTRYLIFKGLNYYPWGGTDYLYGLADALPVGMEVESNQWFNALDLSTLQILLYDPDTKTWNERGIQQHEPKKYFFKARSDNDQTA